MATVNKDFKIKSGLIVEGTTGKINGEDILTKAQADIDYIIGEVGGSGESTNTPDTLVLRDGSGNFAAGTITADLTGDVTGTVSDISNHDTDDLSEGTTNKYFTDQRAQDALSGMYDTAGSASGVQSNLDDHATDTSTHGVTGDIVGTSDDQDLSNKTFKGTTYFQSAGGAGGSNNHIDVDNSTGKLVVESGYAMDLTASSDVKITSGNGNIVLNADGTSYLGTASSGNEIATQGYVGSQGFITSSALSGYATESYVGTAIDNLVDGAPGLLDTLNEIAAAINDDANYATTMSTALSGKQNELTAGTNISIVSDTISVTGLSSTDISDFSTAALSATASAYDASGAAATAEGNANDYTDTALESYTPTSGLDSAIGGYGYAKSIDVPNSTADLTEDSGALYFTDSRAKTSAADLLTSASKTNITITGDENGLTITAENGVADSDTDDLEEGSTNLYFTNQRVLDAVDNADITPNTVQIDTFRKEEATQTYFSSASTATVHSFGYPFGSVKYIVRVVGNVSGTTHSQVTEILATVDGNNNVAVTEFGSIHTTEPALASFTVDYDGGTSQFRLRATTVNAGSEVIVAATLLSWND